MSLDAAMKQLIALGLSEPFRRFDAQIFTTDFPGCEAYAPYSDEHLACLARTYTATIYHPSGTCRMGDARDPTTVVDPELRSLRSSWCNTRTLHLSRFLRMRRSWWRRTRISFILMYWASCRKRTEQARVYRVWLWRRDRASTLQ